jgi:hypothetical protein
LREVNIEKKVKEQKNFNRKVNKKYLTNLEEKSSNYKQKRNKL